MTGSLPWRCGAESTDTAPPGATGRVGALVGQTVDQVVDQTSGRTLDARKNPAVTIPPATTERWCARHIGSQS